MCAGMIQASPHAVRNGAKGSLSRTRTVDSSGVSMDATASKPTLVKAPNFGLVTSSQVNFTSREVKGLPSCHATPFFNRKVYSSPFFAIPPFLTDGISTARFGTNWARSSVRQRLSKMPKWTPRSTSMWGRSGLNTVGSCESPTTTCPPRLGTSAARAAPDRTSGPRAVTAPVPASILSASRRESRVMTPSPGLGSTADDVPVRGGEILGPEPGEVQRVVGGRAERDRKSTRLNSSHTVISYAVFCLKKKKKKYKRDKEN